LACDHPGVVAGQVWRLDDAAMFAALVTTLALAVGGGGQLHDVPVAVLDTGFDLQHPALAPHVLQGVPGRDFAGSDGDPDDPRRGSGHGTAVAGVLAGVAPNARLVPLRSCWDDDQCYQTIQARAIDWAVTRAHARVVSMSWLSGPLEPGLRRAIRRHRDVLFVGIPSGNGVPYDADHEDPEPCDLDAPNVLCVSTGCGAFGARTVDVAVPTRGIRTTLNGGGYGTTACATSYAAPEAAGVAAILFGADPHASASRVRRAIIAGARRVPAWRGRSVSGGIVDAASALRLLRRAR
jgi:subtilisin family serine protease